MRQSVNAVSAKNKLTHKLKVTSLRNVRRYLRVPRYTYYIYICMRKRILLLLAAVYSSAAIQFCVAQTPKWAAKSQKAIFSVVTYDKDNKILSTGNGFFIGENGDALSDYSIFKGAESAVIINADGKQMPVDCILGANEIYDIIKLRVKTGNEKITTLPLSAKAGADQEKVWLLPYSTPKNVQLQSGMF